MPCLRVLLACVLLCMTAVSAASEFPSRTVRFVVGFPPGGAIDTFARMTAAKLSDVWSRQVVVENKPGAGGIIASEGVAKGAADGHSFLFVTVGHVVNPSLYARLPYDSKKDFAAVAMVASVPNLLVVPAASPFHSAQSLITHALQNPEKLSYASSGTATTSHIAVELLAAATGAKMVHVPYKGAAPAVQDLIAGRVDLMLDPIVSSGPHVRAGRLRALAITTAGRTPLLPELPTLAESGVAGYAFEAWFGIVAPSSTSPDIVLKVNHDVAKLLDDPDFAGKLAALGAVPAVALSAHRMNDFLIEEMARWAAVVKGAGIRVE